MPLIGPTGVDPNRRKKKPEPKPKPVPAPRTSSAPAARPTPSPQPAPMPVSNAQVVNEKIESFVTGYRNNTGLGPSPFKVLTFLDSGQDGTAADFSEMFTPVKYDAIANLTRAGEIAKGQTPEQFWADTIAQGEPEDGLPTATKAFEFMFGKLPGAEALVERERILNMDYGEIGSVAEVTRQLDADPTGAYWSKFRSTVFGQMGGPTIVGENGEEVPIDGPTALRLYVFYSNIKDALGAQGPLVPTEALKPGAEGEGEIGSQEAMDARQKEATRKVWQTGIVPRGSDVRLWFESMTGGKPGMENTESIKSEEARKETLFLWSLMGRDPRQTEADFTLQYAQDDLAPASLEPLAIPIGKLAFDTFAAGFGDAIGVNIATETWERAQELADNYGQSLSKEQRGRLGESPAVAKVAGDALIGIINAPFMLFAKGEELASIVGTLGAYDKGTDPGQSRFEGGPLPKDRPDSIRYLEAAIHVAGREFDGQQWAGLKQTIDWVNKSVKETKGKPLAWSVAEAYGLDSTSGPISVGLFFAEMVGMGLVTLPLDWAARGAGRAIRDLLPSETDIGHIGLTAKLEDVWAQTREEFVVRETGMARGLHVPPDIAGEVARDLHTPGQVNFRWQDTGSLINIKGDVDLATPSFLVAVKLRKLTDSSRSPQQRRRFLPLGQRTVDLSDVTRPDEWAFNHAMHQGLPLGESVKWGSRMVRALKTESKELPYDVAAALDRRIKANWEATPAHPWFANSQHAPQDREATALDEIKYLQNKHGGRDAGKYSELYYPEHGNERATALLGAYDKASVREAKARHDAERAESKAANEALKKLNEQHAADRAASVPRIETGEPRTRSSADGSKTKVVDMELWTFRDGEWVRGTESIDASIAADVVGPLDAAGYKMHNSHGLQGDHSQNHPARDKPPSVEFDGDSPAVRATAEKHGLEAEATGGVNPRPQAATYTGAEFGKPASVSAMDRIPQGSRYNTAVENYIKNPNAESFEAARTANIAWAEYNLSAAKTRVGKMQRSFDKLPPDKQAAVKANLEASKAKIARAEQALQDAQNMTHPKPPAPAAPSAPRLTVRNPFQGAKAMRVWRAFVADLVDATRTKSKAEVALEAKIAKEKARKDKADQNAASIRETLKGQQADQQAPITEGQLAKTYDPVFDDRIGGVFMGGDDMGRALSADEITLERNQSVYMGQHLVPLYDLVNKFVPELRNLPIPIAGKGAWNAMVGRSASSVADMIQRGEVSMVGGKLKFAPVEELTRIRKMVALAKFSTIAVIIGSDEGIRFMVHTPFVRNADGSIDKSATFKQRVGVLSRELERRGWLNVSDEMKNNIDAIPEFRSHLWDTVMGEPREEGKVSRVEVSPDDPGYVTAVRQTVANINASNGPRGNQVFRDWLRCLDEAGAEHGAYTPAAYAAARTAFRELVANDPFYTKPGQLGNTLLKQTERAQNEYNQGAQGLADLTQNFADGISALGERYTSHPTLRKWFREGPSAISDAEIYRNKSVRDAFGTAVRTDDVAPELGSIPYVGDTGTVAHAASAAVGTAGIVVSPANMAHTMNALIHPFQSVFGVLGRVTTRMKVVEMQNHYDQAMRLMNEDHPGGDAALMQDAALAYAYNKTKWLSYMSQHSYGEEQIRNGLLFVSPYVQSWGHWFPKMFRNPAKTAMILNLLNDIPGFGIPEAVPGIGGKANADPAKVLFSSGMTPQEDTGMPDWRQIAMGPAFALTDNLGLGAVFSDELGSVYKVLTGDFKPNAPWHAPGEGVFWSMLNEEGRRVYQAGTDNLEGTASVVDQRDKMTAYNLAQQVASGKMPDYEKAVNATRQYEAGLGIAKTVAPLRLSRAQGTLRVAPSENNGKPLNIDLERFGMGQQMWMSAQTNADRSLALSQYPEYAHVARAYELQSKSLTEFLAYEAKHPWVIPFVIKKTQDKPGTLPTVNLWYSDREQYEEAKSPKVIAQELRSRIAQKDKYVLGTKYIPMKDLIENTPLIALKDPKVREAIGPEATDAAQSAIEARGKGEDRIRDLRKIVAGRMMEGLDATFAADHKKEIIRAFPGNGTVIKDGDWKDNLAFEDGNPYKWEDRYQALSKAWDSGISSQRDWVKQSSYYPQFIQQKEEDEAQIQKDQLDFATSTNKANFITGQDPEDSYRIMRSLGVVGNRKQLQAQTDDILSYLKVVDDLDTQIAGLADAEGKIDRDQYRESVFKRDVYLEALRQRYPMLRLSTAGWIQELGYSTPKMDAPQFQFEDRKSRITMKTIESVRAWSKKKLDMAAWDTESGAMDAIKQWDAFSAKWKKVYTSADPKLRPALDELLRADIWGALSGAFEGVRKQLLAGGYTTGSKDYKYVVDYIRILYTGARKLSPDFATEVDAMFGKKDFVEYMVNPRMESTSNISKIAKGAEIVNSNKSIVAYAKQFVGTPYEVTKNGPDAFDCSGFVQWVYRNAGGLKNFPTYTGNQGKLGQHVAYSTDGGSQSKLATGDLVFFVTHNEQWSDSRANPWGDTEGYGHVGMYIGNGTVIHAGNPVHVESLSSLTSSYPHWEARRYKLKTSDTKRR